MSWMSAFRRVLKIEFINETRRPQSPRFRTQFKVSSSELPSDNSRCQKEQQFLRLDCGGCPLEEISDQRQAADDGNLLDVRVLRRDDDSPDDDRAAVWNQYFGLRRLSVQRRDTLHAGNTLIDLGILDEHVHEDCAFSRNLRRYFELQHGVDELHRDGVVDGRLNRQLDALLDDRLFVVLRHDARLGKELADAFGFRSADKEVEREVCRPK